MSTGSRSCHPNPSPRSRQVPGTPAEYGPAAQSSAGAGVPQQSWMRPRVRSEEFRQARRIPVEYGRRARSSAGATHPSGPHRTRRCSQSLLPLLPEVRSLRSPLASTTLAGSGRTVWSSAGDRTGVSAIGVRPAGFFTDIDVSADHTCGVRPDGMVKCWGSDRWARLDAPSGSFTEVRVGAAQSCGLRDDGTILCWGSNQHGQSDTPSGLFTKVSTGTVVSTFRAST